MGIQAVVTVGISKIVAHEPSSTFAISLDVSTLETAGRPFRLSPVTLILSESDGKNTADDLTKAADVAADSMKAESIRVIDSLPWHAHIVSVEGDKIFIDAGWLSGIKSGDLLEVYKPGEQIIDQITGRSLGRLKGSFKGEIQVSGLYGRDGSWGRATEKGVFSYADLVYLKKRGPT